MSGKISEYANEALVIGDDDWFDISVDTGSGFESKKLKGSTVKALIASGVNLGTSNLTQTDPARTFDCDNGNLSFINGKEVSISSGEINMTKTKVTGSLTSVDEFITDKAIYERGVQFINTTPTAVAAGSSIAAVDTTGGAIEITLPSASIFAGRKITVIDYRGNSETNNITITPDGVQTINGESNAILRENFSWLVLHSDGSNWIARRSYQEQVTGWTSYAMNDIIGTVDSSTPLSIDFTPTIVNTTNKPKDALTYWDGEKIPCKENESLLISFNCIAEQLGAPGNHHFNIIAKVGATEIAKQSFRTNGSGEFVFANFTFNVGCDSAAATNGIELVIDSTELFEVTHPKLTVTRVYNG